MKCVLLTASFLCCVSPENHILEDVNKCVIALQEKDVDGLDRTAGAIRGRAARVVHVVTSEMDNYEPGVYTEKVLEATKLLTDTGTAETCPRSRPESAVLSHSANTPHLHAAARSIHVCTHDRACRGRPSWILNTEMKY